MPSAKKPLSPKKKALGISLLLLCVLALGTAIVPRVYDAMDFSSDGETLENRITAEAVASVYDSLHKEDPYEGTLDRDSIGASRGLDEVLTAEEAREDLDYMMDRLRERHPAWLDGSGKHMLVETQYEKELSALGESISVLDFYRMAARIAAVLHDGHTSVSWRFYGAQAQSVIDPSTVPQNAGWPLSINGVPAEEVLEAYKEITSYEIEEYAEVCFWDYMVWRESKLRMCRVDTSNGVDMAFQTENGEQTVHFDFVQPRTTNTFAIRESYSIDEKNNVGIFTLPTCQYDEYYRKMLGAFFEKVFSSGVENVVVDLRGNQGGNSRVANEFLSYLDIDEYHSWPAAVRHGWFLEHDDDVVTANEKKDRVFDGNLYVLTDVYTYSSGMDFAMLVADNHLGTLIGEPCGNLPDSYGDILRFQLPHSQLNLTVSYKKWWRVDPEKTGEPVTPDILCPSEEAMEKAYELIRSQS